MATRTPYVKLVRDRIPEIIERHGGRHEVAIMADDEYRRALREKQVEEAREVADADTENLVAELADAYEVVDAVLAAHRIDRRTVLMEQRRRRAERGGFAARLSLIWSE